MVDKYSFILVWLFKWKDNTNDMGNDDNNTVGLLRR